MSESHQHSFNSPIGRIHLTEEGGAIAGLTWVSRETSTLHSDNAITNLLVEAERQIHAYFAKERRDFDLPLAFNRGSAFEQSVWRAMQEIPFGTVWTYGDIADHVGGVARAVGGGG